MSQETFAALGVSAESIAALERARHHQPLPDPVRVRSRRRSPAPTCSRSRRPARARRSPSAIPIVERIDARRRAPRGPRPRPDPRARRSRSSTSSRSLAHAARPPGRRRLRRRRLAAAGEARRATRTSSSPRPGRLEDLLDRRARRRSTRSRSSSSTRPTACSTWASSRRSTGSSRDLPRDRQTMFFSATLDGAVGELAAAYTRSPRAHRGRAAEPSTGPARSSTASSRSRHDAKVDALVELRDAERGRTLVFVRTKRGADRLVKKLGSREGRRGRDARRQDPEPARSARSRGFERGKVTRSSPPTSPPAGSTSTTSPT